MAADPTDQNDAFEDRLREAELSRFRASIGDEKDLVMLILRSHLFSESLLERLLRARLPRGDRLIDGASLTFAQKLAIVDAFDIFPEAIVASLRGLNRLRNECAHELEKKITERDITRIGSPLGKEYPRFRREARFDDAQTLRSVLDYVCGFVTAMCVTLEHPEQVLHRKVDGERA